MYRDRTPKASPVRSAPVLLCSFARDSYSVGGLLSEWRRVRRSSRRKLLARLHGWLPGHDRLAVHVRRNRNAKQVEHGGSDVHDARPVNVDRPIAKEHAGNLRWIHVV